VILWHYAPDFSGYAPRPLYIFCTYCMFMYQTLDAIDGKQARNTGSSSPLGQLFDHGCDAICAFISGLFVASTLQLGPTYGSLITMLLHIVPFYVSNWEEVQTGFMRFGIIGVTEGQLVVMSLLILTGLFGGEMWLWRLPVVNVQLNTIPVLVGFGGVIVAISDTTYHVRKYWSENKTEQNRITEGLYQIGQFAVFESLAVIHILVTYNGLYKEHARIMLFTMGVIFSYLVSRLIISKVAHMPYPRVHDVLIPYPFIVLNSIIGGPIDEYVLSAGYLMLASAVYCHYSYSVVVEICRFLGIRCFHIVPQNPTVPGSPSLGNSGATTTIHAFDKSGAHITTTEAVDSQKKS